VACGACAACAAGADNLCAERRLYGCVLGLDGAFADHVDVRAENVVALAGPAPPAWAALAEPLAVGAHAARIGGIGPGSRVVVVGGGPIGAGAAWAARRAGAREVLVSEPDLHRREVLGRLGLEAVEPSAVAPGAADVALECVGVPATVAAALEAVAPGAGGGRGRGWPRPS
jgi:L-iditol 2-dehydrogenase